MLHPSVELTRCICNAKTAAKNRSRDIAELGGLIPAAMAGRNHPSWYLDSSRATFDTHTSEPVPAGVSYCPLRVSGQRNNPIGLLKCCTRLDRPMNRNTTNGRC
jgi:hypothetical protein